MHYVYILKSRHFDKIYIGFTSSIDQRIKDHNAGKVSSTKQYKPWECVTYTAFQDKQKAMDFERYLKSHSGRAFLRKRLI